MQPDNEIWSINRIQQGKYFSSKVMPENEAGRLIQDLFFLFFKKEAFYEVKASGLQLRLNIF